MSNEMLIEFIAGKKKAIAGKKRVVKRAKPRAIQGKAKPAKRRRVAQALSTKPAQALRRTGMVGLGVAGGALTIKIVDEKAPKIPKVATRAGVTVIGVFGVMKAKQQDVKDFSLGYGAAGAVSLTGQIIKKQVVLQGGGSNAILLSGSQNRLVVHKNLNPYSDIPQAVYEVY